MAWNTCTGMKMTKCHFHAQNALRQNPPFCIIHELLLVEIGLGRALVCSASPYRQNATARMKGCQIDLLIQTRKGAYIVEIKRRGHIGEDVVDEVEKKVSALKVSLDKSIRTVLVYDGELSKRVPADAFFSFIISSDRLLGKG